MVSDNDEADLPMPSVERSTAAAGNSELPARNPPGRKTKPERGDKRYGRSATSNGKDLLAGIDQRSAIYRRYRDIVELIVGDQAGAALSEVRKGLIRQYAAARVLAEAMDSRITNGEQISIAEFAALSSTLCRLSSRIGLDREQKNITPTVEQYLASKRREAST